MTSSAAPNKEITAPSDRPDPSRSLPLSAARQALVNDIIALYSCHPTRERILRYTPDCVYDDQFVHADDRYKVAGQWYALPQLFEASINEGYQVVRNDSKVIQFKIAQVSSPFPLHRPGLTLRDVDVQDDCAGRNSEQARDADDCRPGDTDPRSFNPAE